MSGFELATIESVDERIAKALAALPELHPAVMISRDSTGTGGTAQFFGSAQAVPVKVPGTVDAFAGDGVGLARFGPSDWVVVYSYPMWGSSEAGVNSITGNDTTSSATYSAISGVPTFTWRKRYDGTRVALRMTAGMFAAAFPSQAEFGMQLDDGVNPATDNFLVRLRTDAGGHVSASAEDFISGLPAGVYTITARWRKTAGGLAQLNNIDTVSMTARETGALHP